MSKRITIAVAEDHDFVRQGFLSVLSNYERFKVVFDVQNGQELLRRLKTTQPDIILLDIEMPVLGGLEALVKINKLYPKIKVIIISAHFEAPFIIEAFKNGVKAFLPKKSKEKEVINAIIKVFEEGAYFDKYTSSIMARELANPTANEYNKTEKNKLTEREIFIIRQICDGKTSQQIANKLKLSIKTVEADRSKIFKKTGTESAIELVQFAIKNKV